jgi:hypothetical protein
MHKDVALKMRSFKKIPIFKFLDWWCDNDLDHMMHYCCQIGTLVHCVYITSLHALPFFSAPQTSGVSTCVLFVIGCIVL